MNNILNLFKPEVIEISLKGNQDPVPSFIDKLSSGEDLKIKIQTSNDNIIVKNKKNFDSLAIPYESSKKNFQFPKPDRCLSIFSNKRSPDFPTKEQKSLLKSAPKTVYRKGACKNCGAMTHKVRIIIILIIIIIII
jgi:hypothetical protein